MKEREKQIKNDLNKVIVFYIKTWRKNFWIRYRMNLEEIWVLETDSEIVIKEKIDKAYKDFLSNQDTWWYYENEDNN